MPSMWDLTGRTALVTGAGSPTGIGFAAAVGISRRNERRSIAEERA